MFVQQDPNVAPCSYCNRRVMLDTVKYHTSTNKEPVHIFCGAECSLKWHQREWECKE